MKKFLLIFGGIALIALLLATIFIGYSVYKGRSLDASSKEYVDNTVPMIVSSWSKDELLKRASPQLLQVISEKPDHLDSLFHGFAKLGAIRSYDGSRGEANVSYTNKSGKVISASYTADVKFENGNAQIRVRLVQVSGSWQFLMFNVDSPLFGPGS